MKVNGKYDRNENVWKFKIMLTDMMYTAMQF